MIRLIAAAIFLFCFPISAFAQIPPAPGGNNATGRTGDEARRQETCANTQGRRPIDKAGGKQIVPDRRHSHRRQPVPRREVRAFHVHRYICAGGGRRVGARRVGRLTRSGSGTRHIRAENSVHQGGARTPSKARPILRQGRKHQGICSIRFPRSELRALRRRAPARRQPTRIWHWHLEALPRQASVPFRHDVHPGSMTDEPLS